MIMMMNVIKSLNCCAFKFVFRTKKVAQSKCGKLVENPTLPKKTKAMLKAKTNLQF